MDQEIDLVTTPVSKLVRQVSIGGGGYGTVYKTNHADWGEVAFKKLPVSSVSPKDRARLESEAAIHLSLCHPNIVKMMAMVCEEGIDGSPGSYGLVMEYMNGGELGEYLEDHKLTWKEKLPLILGAAFGMSYLHSQKPPVIHGDLKIQNVLINVDECGHKVVKICDFGFSIWKEFSKSHSKNITFSGTFTHIPPEHFNEPYRRKSEAFDVFGFGILMWEVMTEKRPYKGIDLSLISDWVGKKNNRPEMNEIPDEVTPGSVELMQKCWSLKIEDRPTFVEIIDALQQEMNVDANCQEQQPERQIQILDGQGGVAGVTWLEGRVYVVCFHSNRLHVFHGRIPYDRLQAEEIEISGMKSCYDMVACEQNKLLFISDFQLKFLWKIQIPDKHVRRCEMNGAPSRMSIMPPEELIVVMEKKGRFHLKMCRSSHMKSQKRIELPTSVKFLQHAVPNSSGNLIVAWFGATADHPESYKVSEMTIDDTTGTFSRTFDLSTLLSPVDPNHLSIDENNRVFIADLIGSRVLVLNSQLTDCKVWFSQDQQHQLVRPRRLHYKCAGRQLFVGQSPRSENKSSGMSAHVETCVDMSVYVSIFKL